MREKIAGRGKMVPTEGQERGNSEGKFVSRIEMRCKCVRAHQRTTTHTSLFPMHLRGLELGPRMHGVGKIRAILRGDRLPS